MSEFFNLSMSFSQKTFNETDTTVNEETNQHATVHR